MRKLVLLTALLLVLSAIAIFWISDSDLPDSIAINTEGQPTIGYPKAKVHLVLFEEPKCVNCKYFTLHLYPRIKKEFIDTNKITYTVIPVSFLPGSMPAAIALLCVYNAHPEYPNDDLFFTYLDYLYAHQPDEHTDWASLDTLLEFAKKSSPAIQIDALKQCIEEEGYRIQIEQNTLYGRKLMGGIISTPTLYVNGIEVKNLTWNGVADLIKEVLADQGVHQ